MKVKYIQVGGDAYNIRGTDVYLERPIPIFPRSTFHSFSPPKSWFSPFEIGRDICSSLLRLVGPLPTDLPTVLLRKVGSSIAADGSNWDVRIDVSWAWEIYKLGGDAEEYERTWEVFGSDDDVVDVVWVLDGDLWGGRWTAFGVGIDISSISSSGLSCAPCLVTLPSSCPISSSELTRERSLKLELTLSNDSLVMISSLVEAAMGSAVRIEVRELLIGIGLYLLGPGDNLEFPGEWRYMLVVSAWPSDFDSVFLWLEGGK